MRISHSVHLTIAYALLIGAVTSLCYGMIAWHATAFDMQGVWFYDNGWRPHPVHFIALGIGVAAPVAWDIFVLALAAGERRYDANQRRAMEQAEGRARAKEEEEEEERENVAERADTASPRAGDCPSPPQTFVRPVNAADQREFLAITQGGRDFHAPWIKAPLTAHTFKAYLRRTARDDYAAFAICLRESGEMVGIINLNNILGGGLRSAVVAYFAAKRHAGKGYMRDGLRQLKAHAFEELRLHRLEANIQPGNTASIALVRSCGFVREGVSRRFLYIDGAWRDHERWAAVDDREDLR